MDPFNKWTAIQNVIQQYQGVKNVCSVSFHVHLIRSQKSGNTAISLAEKPGHVRMTSLPL